MPASIPFYRQTRLTVTDWLLIVVFDHTNDAIPIILKSVNGTDHLGAPLLFPFIDKGISEKVYPAGKG